MAFEKFKTCLSLFFQSCAFFIVFFMLMRVGLQTVHQAPVIRSPLLKVVPIEMRESKDVSDSSYLKAEPEYTLKETFIKTLEMDLAKKLAKVEAETPKKDIEVLVTKRVQNGMPFVSVSVSKTFEVPKEELQEDSKKEESLKEETTNDLSIQEEDLQSLLHDNPFTIQLVTYRSEARAQEEVANLKKSGYNSFIIPSGDFFQVCINRFKEKEVALQQLSELKNVQNFYSYQDAYVRPVMR